MNRIDYIAAAKRRERTLDGLRYAARVALVAAGLAFAGVVLGAACYVVAFAAGGHR